MDVEKSGYFFANSFAAVMYFSSMIPAAKAASNWKLASALRITPPGVSSTKISYTFLSDATLADFYVFVQESLDGSSLAVYYHKSPGLKYKLWNSELGVLVRTDTKISQMLYCRFHEIHFDCNTGI